MLKQRIFILMVVCWLSASVEARQRIILFSVKPLALIGATVLPKDSIQILLNEGQTPHTFSLRPSHIHQLQQADKVVWAGKAMEPYLEKWAKKSPEKWLDMSRLIASEITEKSQRLHDERHLWFNPHVVLLLSQRLVSVEKSVNAYKTFKQRFLSQIETHKKQLSTYQDRSFYTYHGAFDEWIAWLGVNYLGAFTHHAQLQPGLKQIKRIRQSIKDKKAHCLITEPQFKSDLIDNIASELRVKVGVLDPLAGGIMVNENGYLTWLQQMADALEQCLSNEP